MRIAEMQDKLENLQTDLSIIHGTLNMTNTALENGALSEDVNYAIFGITKEISNTIQDVRALVDETIKMQKNLNML